ncbi:hypothetical protein GEV33_005667 [Tenebrio molitor]|uniref:Uncharacterized protein n=1 Tax=Tenebrio molitor TaxID=7067 RepID=A0A8J6HM08_TENMO|nr:hypothetical protein GEV33_005667 [Tenebrio molitor]
MSTQKVNILQNKVIKPMEDEETNFSLPSLIDSESLLQEIGFMEQVDDNEEAEAFTTQPPTRGKGKGKGKTITTPPEASPCSSTSSFYMEDEKSSVDQIQQEFETKVKHITFQNGLSDPDFRYRPRQVGERRGKRYKVCNRSWRTRGGRPNRLENHLRGIPTETPRRIKASFTRVNDPTHKRSNFVTLLDRRHPQGPLRRAGPHTGLSLAEEPESRSNTYLARPGVTSPETTRSLGLNVFFDIVLSLCLVVFPLFHRGPKPYSSRFPLGRVEGRKDPRTIRGYGRRD